MSIDKTKTPWKNGYYYSTKATQMLQKFEGNTAEAYSHMCLDFPDLKPMGPPGTITYGDFGPARAEIQKASGGIKNYNVEIILFHGKIPASNSKIIKCIGLFKSLNFWVSNVLAAYYII